MNTLSTPILAMLLFAAFSCTDDTKQANNNNTGGCTECPAWSDWYVAQRLSAGRLITASGEVLTWGDNQEGRLADGSLYCSYIPLQVDGVPAFSGLTIHGGTLEVLGISPEGSVYGWGSRSYARGTPNHTPIPWDLGFAVETIACDYAGCAAITPDGRLMAQGFGAIPGTEQFIHLTADATLQSVTIGEGHLCALDTEGHTWCAGDNQFGQSAPGSDATSIPALTLLPDAPLFMTLFTRAVFTCGITSEGALYCWGDGDHFPVDQPSQPELFLPELRFNAICLWPDIVGALASGGIYLSDNENNQREVLTSHNFVEVRCDYSGWCARSDEGRLFCGGADRTIWGTGAEDDGRVSMDDAVEVYGSHTFSQVAIGSINGASDCIDPHHFACALDSDGAVWCWGENTLGSLGAAITTASTALLPAVPVLDAVAATPWYVLDAEGDLWMTKRTLAENRIIAKAFPLTTGHNLERLGRPSGLYGGHCAIDDQGVPWCWRHCLEAIEEPADATCTPQPITLPGRAVMTASLLNKSCAIIEGGEIFCWDYVAYGSNFTLLCDLGQHCTTTEPYVITGVTGPATFISSSADELLVLYSDGSVHTFHDSNGLGELPLPKDYAPLHGFRTVQVIKTAHTLIGLDDAGELMVWRTPANTPLPMENAPGEVVQITAMGDISDDYCALDASGSLWCGTVDEAMELIFAP